MAPPRSIVADRYQSLAGAVREFVVALADRILADRDENWMPTTGEIPDVATMLQQLNPLTSTAASFARHLDTLLSDYVAGVMPTLYGDAPPDDPASTASASANSLDLA